jgi:hypothetical protein
MLGLEHIIGFFLAVLVNVVSAYIIKHIERKKK